MNSPREKKGMPLQAAHKTKGETEATRMLMKTDGEAVKKSTGERMEKQGQKQRQHWQLRKKQETGAKKVERDAVTKREQKRVKEEEMADIASGVKKHMLVKWA